MSCGPILDIHEGSDVTKVTLETKQSSSKTIIPEKEKISGTQRDEGRVRLEQSNQTKPNNDKDTICC